MEKLRIFRLGDTSYYVDERRKHYAVLVGQGKPEFATWLPYVDIEVTPHTVRIVRDGNTNLSFHYDEVQS